jgi:hypothetical protein
MGKLKILFTPNSLNLFDGHAYEQHKRLGGIGDKLKTLSRRAISLGSVTNTTPGISRIGK